MSNSTKLVKGTFWDMLDNGNERMQVNGYHLIVGPIRADLSFQGVIKDGAMKVVYKIQGDSIDLIKLHLKDAAKHI